MILEPRIDPLGGSCRKHAGDYGATAHEVDLDRVLGVAVRDGGEDEKQDDRAQSHACRPDLRTSSPAGVVEPAPLRRCRGLDKRIRRRTTRGGDEHKQRMPDKLTLARGLRGHTTKHGS